MVMQDMPGQLAQARDIWRRTVSIISDLAVANQLTPSGVVFVDDARQRLAAVEARLARGEK